MAKFRRFSRKWVDNYGSIRHQGKLVAWLMAKPCVWLGSPGSGCALCVNLVRHAQVNRISLPAAVKLSDDSEGTEWSRFEINGISSMQPNAITTVAVYFIGKLSSFT